MDLRCLKVHHWGQAVRVDGVLVQTRPDGVALDVPEKAAAKLLQNAKGWRRATPAEVAGEDPKPKAAAPAPKAEEKPKAPAAQPVEPIPTETQKEPMQAAAEPASSDSTEKPKKRRVRDVLGLGGEE